jgi:hypothetical protein
MNALIHLWNNNVRALRRHDYVAANNVDGGGHCRGYGGDYSRLFARRGAGAGGAGNIDGSAGSGGGGDNDADGNGGGGGGGGGVVGVVQSHVVDALVKAFETTVGTAAAAGGGADGRHFALSARSLRRESGLLGRVGECAFPFLFLVFCLLSYSFVHLYCLRLCMHHDTLVYALCLLSYSFVRLYCLRLCMHHDTLVYALCLLSYSFVRLYCLRLCMTYGTLVYALELFQLLV